MMTMGIIEKIKTIIHFENWNVAYSLHQEGTSFSIIPNTLRYWAADPFVIMHGDRYYVFAELYDKILTRGKLGYCVIDSNGRITSSWKIVIDNKMHMSFPNVYQVNHDIFMMPETNRENELYVLKADLFPRRWYKTESLFKSRVADSIFLTENLILAYDNFSFPFKLYIYEKKEKKWERIITVEDIEKKLRPAGCCICSEKECFVIPMQNCKEEYGKSINITKVWIDKEKKRISTIILKEITASSIETNKSIGDIKGIHTINRNNGMTVIDIKTAKFSFVRLIGYILKKFGLTHKAK